MRNDELPPSPLAAEAVAGVGDPALRQLFGEHWEWSRRSWPTWATTLGDHRFDHRLSPADGESIARLAAERREFLSRARALGDERLDAADRVNWAMFVNTLEGDAGIDACRFHEWLIQAG